MTTKTVEQVMDIHNVTDAKHLSTILNARRDLENFFLEGEVETVREANAFMRKHPKLVEILCVLISNGEEA